MSELAKPQVIRLATSPLYVIYAVASALVPPGGISRRKIIRALEYGLTPEGDLPGRIFDLLKMNLHEFYAIFPQKFPDDFVECCLQELREVHQLLAEADLPEEQTADFRNTLIGLGNFVARGSLFEGDVPLGAMEAQVARIEAIFASDPGGPTGKPEDSI